MLCSVKGSHQQQQQQKLQLKIENWTCRWRSFLQFYLFTVDNDKTQQQQPRYDDVLTQHFFVKQNMEREPADFVF